jgi:hypothetical protein
VLHGFLFCGLIALIVPRLTEAWQLWLAVSLEAVWEAVENSRFVIERYREETAALGYRGDTIVNSLADILLCAIGFVLARRLGFRTHACAVRGNGGGFGRVDQGQPQLNVLMLIYPIEAVKEWQAAGH